MENKLGGVGIKPIFKKTNPRSSFNRDNYAKGWCSVITVESSPRVGVL